MDNLKLNKQDLAEANFHKLAAMFPNAVTETVNESGEVIRTIDADVLRQEISVAVVEGPQERYQFTWPGKKKQVVLANTPTTKTLLLDQSRSVGHDGTRGNIDTENIYIEGDNLDALKLLRETYFGKIKMIYIDPPYNTGSNFIYKDNFSMTKKKYMEVTSQFDEEESNGLFHTDWLNMLYPRLRIAKDLLTDDGIIFISIDDNEVENLKKICDEIYGTKNFISQIVWVKTRNRKNSAINFSSSHEYLLCYAKRKRKRSNDNGFKRNLLPRENTSAYSNPDHDPRGSWKTETITAHNYYSADYTITKPNGVVIQRPQGRYWAHSEETIKKMIDEGTIIWGDGDSMPRKKSYLCDVQEGLVPVSLFSREFAGDYSQAKKNIDELFPDCRGIFDYTKPVKLIYRLLQIGSNTDDIILDFFSGSATTAHAVMQLNAEDGGNRKFIMVQLPEVTREKSEARKAGFETICDIGEERIRRAGDKIRAETGADIDCGFRVFRVDPANAENVYYNDRPMPWTM